MQFARGVIMKLQAHRGDSKRFPENTMWAFRAAYDEGYDIIELDMKFTKDKKCIILHDFTLNRTARHLDGSQLESETKISEVNFDELSEYDVGIYMSEKFKGEKIPTLEEVLIFACEKNIKLKFDNVLQRFDDECQEIFFDTVERHYKDGIIGFTSNDLDFIKKTVRRFPECDIHYDGEVTEESLDELKRIICRNPLYIWLPLNKISWLSFPAATREQVEMAKEYGTVGLWIITDPSELARCFELGADLIETDGAVTSEML